MNSEKAPVRLPLSTVTLVFGALSLPFAFARHLVSLAVVLGVLAVAFGVWGRSRAARHLLRYTDTSIRHARTGQWMGLAGLALAVVMWVLWRTNLLLQ
jgi:hypothetical protein